MIILLSFYNVSCILFNNQIITVHIPETPQGWDIVEGDCAVCVEYYAGGRKEVVTGAGFGDEIDIETGKEIVPVCAYPVLKSGEIRLKPAGAVFPAVLSDDELLLTWEDGFSAEVILLLSEKGVDFSNFNIRRFQKVLKEKSGCNPWKISDTSVLYSLSVGIFNSNQVSLRRSFDILLSDIFLKDEWILAEPLDSRSFNSPAGEISLENICTGRFVLLGKDLPGFKYAELFINKDSWTVFFSGGEGGLSGSL